jgi:hypothetical protein
MRHPCAQFWALTDANVCTGHMLGDGGTDRAHQVRDLAIVGT